MTMHPGPAAVRPVRGRAVINLRPSSFPRRLTALAVLLGAVVGTFGAAEATAAGTVGTVPPATPAANCSAPSTITDPLSVIDYCRAQEGVGPVTLPGNWSTLTPALQTLVILNLERIGRGLVPIVGLNSQLDTLAQTAAENNGDPSFPSSGIDGGGGIWADGSSTLAADYGWMYDDGPGGFNGDCTAVDTSGCWGHRDNILIDSSSDQLIGGSGYAADNDDGFNSYAFEMDYDAGNPANYPPDDFTWSSELSSFASAPTIDPLPVPTITAVSPSSGTQAGGTTITLTGSALSAVTAISIGGNPATQLACSSDTTCTALTPASPAGTATVSATNPAGTSSTAGPHFVYTATTTTSTPGTGTGAGTGTPKSTPKTALRVRVSRIRVVHHRISFTLALTSGSAAVTAVATRARRRVTLRTHTAGRSVAVSGTLGPGRWTITLRYRVSRQTAAHAPAVLRVTVR